MRTTTDELELPIAVAGSSQELAEMLGTSSDVVLSSISHNHPGWHRIIITEENDEQI